MFIERHDFAITTDAAGAATVFSPKPATGLIWQIRYVPDGSTPLATGTNLAITAEASGLVIDTLSSIGTAAIQWVPRQATSTVAGAAALYAAGGTAINDSIAVASERIKIVVSSGGNVLKGTVYIWVG